MLKWQLNTRIILILGIKIYGYLISINEIYKKKMWDSIIIACKMPKKLAFIFHALFRQYLCVLRIHSLLPNSTRQFLGGF